jgi:Protein of unknown function (DUF3606)
MPGWILRAASPAWAFLMNTTAHRPKAGNTDSIDATATWELNYWASRWGVTPEAVLAAVCAVGTNLRIVQAYVFSTRGELRA